MEKYQAVDFPIYEDEKGKYIIIGVNNFLYFHSQEGDKVFFFVDKEGIDVLSYNEGDAEKHIHLQCFDFEVYLIDEAGLSTENSSWGNVLQQFPYGLSGSPDYLYQVMLKIVTGQYGYETYSIEEIEETFENWGKYTEVDQMNLLTEMFPAFASFHSNLEGEFRIYLYHFSALLGIDVHYFVMNNNEEELLKMIEMFSKAGFLVGYNSEDEEVVSFLTEQSYIGFFGNLDNWKI